MLSGDTARPYLTEGVGEDFFPGTYDPSVVDRWVRVSRRGCVRGRAAPDPRGGDPGRRVVRHRAGRGADRRARAGWPRRRPRRGHRRAAAGRRALLPVQALQRRVDAHNGLLGSGAGRERVRAVLARRHHGPRAAARGPGPDHGARGSGHRDAPALWHQPDARDRARRRRHRGHRGVDRREEACSSARTATRPSWSGPSAR